VTRVEAALARVGRDLDLLGRRWALVGGLAVSARTEPRFTRDADVAVAVADDDDAEAVVGMLRARSYRVTRAIEQEATRRLAAVRVVPPGETEGGVVLDLLFASSGIEPEVAAAAERLELLPGLHVPVASLGHLIALKLLSRDDATRPLDRADLVALARRADAAQLDAAREALTLILARGFGRGRDLLADLLALTAT
jgi:predicted nucleotidyltransferase